ncbi:hypothetical protein L873DRAFT_674498 [Choiromyces venosus 120613-1]|uniref:Uncharacterized protein n=1 Tax=Choiromyces venosus 120613-1 TaxID=1336337 RepID=A0A3N4JSM4_9PEZI|nr:hypothetical protein L873DRAFT_674498 [Choiromyces venosus 120613-1]
MFLLNYYFFFLILSLKIGWVSAAQKPAPQWKYPQGYHIMRKIVVKATRDGASAKGTTDYWIPAFLRITYSATSIENVDIKVMPFCDNQHISPDSMRWSNIGRVAQELAWDQKEQFDAEGKYQGSFYTENVQNSLDKILQGPRDMDKFVEGNARELKAWWDSIATQGDRYFPRSTDREPGPAMSDAVRGVKKCAPPTKGEASQPYITHKQKMSTHIMDLEHTITAELCKRIETAGGGRKRTDFLSSPRKSSSASNPI